MAERKRHVHGGYVFNDGDCPECVEHNDITNTLLAASGDLLDGIEEQENPSSIVLTDVIIDYIDTLRTAIAKAKGETP